MRIFYFDFFSLAYENIKFKSFNEREKQSKKANQFFHQVCVSFFIGFFFLISRRLCHIRSKIELFPCKSIFQNILLLSFVSYASFHINKYDFN